MSHNQVEEHYPGSTVRCGVAQGDITPPVGIYHRMWGAATHDRSTGVHRPLTATALAIAPSDLQRANELTIYLSLDHCLLWAGEMSALLGKIAAGTSIPVERIMTWFSHTHSSGLMGMERASLPGGDLIAPYLERLGDILCRLVNAARDAMEPVAITYGQGRCTLAAHRDFWDADGNEFACGYNPAGPADDTVVVARGANAGGRTTFTLVNYACHPTTLAWENTLISPDYIGAMRETIEGATQAPCFFVQGASGDLGPRHGFVGDPNVADKNGRMLGYASLAALEALPPPDVRFAYAGRVVSGATLGIWKYAPIDEAEAQQHRQWNVARFETPLDYRAELPRRDDCERELARWQQDEQAARKAGDELRARDCRAQAERMTRQLLRLRVLPPGERFPYPVQAHRMGNAIWLAVEGEHYQIFQTELRRRRPDATWVIGTLANGSRTSYLPSRDAYVKGLYQESIALLAPGSLERLIDVIAETAV